MFVVDFDRKPSYALALNKRVGMSSVMDWIMESWEVTKLSIWFSHKYFAMDYEDDRRIVIPYAQVSSLEFDKPFAKDGYAYIGALIVTTKAQYALMFRGKLNEIQEKEGDIESDALYENKMDLERFIFDVEIEELDEFNLILDITDMGGICL